MTPRWLKGTAARVFSPMSTDATRDESTSAGVMGALIERLHGVMGRMRRDPHLVDGRLAGLAADAQSRGDNVATMLGRVADRLLGGGQQVAPLFVAALGQFGMAQEAGGIGLPGGAGGEIALPASATCRSAHCATLAGSARYASAVFISRASSW